MFDDESDAVKPLVIKLIANGGLVEVG